MSALKSDFKHALRMSLKTPGFTIAVVAALAIGIGADNPCARSSSGEQETPRRAARSSEPM